MSAQLIVIIAALILVLAIVGSLIFLHGYNGRFTFDTKTGTAPRASEGEGSLSGTQYKGRFRILTVGISAAFAGLLAKLWSMQMVSSDYYETQAQKNQTRTVTTPADRGRILDRNGTALVSNRDSLAVVGYKDLEDNSVLVHHLANVLGMPYVAVLRNIQDNTEGAQSLHTIATDVRRSTVAYIQEHSSVFDGVQIAERTERKYHYGETACHLLGYTGTVTQEQLEAQEDGSGNGISYQSGDIVGQAGVEYMYESLLQGIRGEQTVTVDANGNVTGQAEAVPAKPGSDIRLTIDLSIQQACEEGLNVGMEAALKSGYGNAKCGACVCMDVTNGEILGMASKPTYDPSVFIGGISNDKWNEFNDDKGDHALVNRAINGQYMSASTIKPLGALAALEYGIMGKNDAVNCSGWWTGLGEGNGKWCWLETGHGSQTLQQGITNSCDVVFYEIGKGFFYSQDDPDGLQEMYRRYGLGAKTGIDLPSEAEGRVPDAEWKESYFKDWSSDERTWNAGDMTNIAIGQGDILVTPLQMATAYMGIANSGVEWTPHVFLSAVSRDGVGDSYLYNDSGTKERLKAKVHEESDIELVKNGLVGVIYEEAESTASHWNNMTVKVAGKTGTGEKTGEDLYGWFCCYAPADEPKYVVSCLIEEGGFGADSAMYAARYVLGAIYNEPDTSTEIGGDSAR